MGTALFSFHDYDSEPTRTSVNTVNLNSANFDAQATFAGALRTAINGLTLAQVEKATLTDVLWNNTTPVTDPQAQRETKWVVIVKDTANETYRGMEIPIADLSILENNDKYIVKQGSVTVVAGAAAVQAFIDAFEAFAVDRFGNALIVWDVYQAGRNS